MFLRRKKNLLNKIKLNLDIGHRQHNWWQWLLAALVFVLIIFWLGLVIFGVAIYRDLNQVFIPIDQTRISNTFTGSLKTAKPLINNLPELLGYEREKNYLLIFQNNMELRPTGGFIGSYGLVTLKNGEITNIFTDDVYNLDKLAEDKLAVEAPLPLQKYNRQDIMFLRDANWSPDWPTSANQISWFFQQEMEISGQTHPDIDGVIAITPNFIADLLDFFGPVESHGVIFTKDNFAMDLERFVEFDYRDHGVAFSDRKDIIGEIASTIIGRIKTVSPLQYFRLWLVLKKNIDEKQILTHLTDDALQKQFKENNWAGEVLETAGDYLLVIDSNLAALKTDAVMDKSIRYDLRLNEAGDLLARLAITYHHQGDQIQDIITRYRDYVRVYVPADTQFITAGLISSTGTADLKIGADVEIGRELGKQFAATFLTVEPRETKTLVLEYQLPARIKNQYQKNLYKFSVQKQPGTVGHNLEINLNFSKPLVAFLSDNQPSSFTYSTARWETNLAVDRNFTIMFND